MIFELTFGSIIVLIHDFNVDKKCVSVELFQFFELNSMVNGFGFQV